VGLERIKVYTECIMMPTSQYMLKAFHKAIKNGIQYTDGEARIFHHRRSRA